MANEPFDIGELHWLFGIIQHVDVGLVVLDRTHRVKLWNGFMENHSGVSAAQMNNRNLFEMFPEIDADWLRHKLDSVFLLDTSSFATWQQRPYLLRFNSYRPITGQSEWMYQNVTLFPLTSARNTVDHVCLMVYDVTDMALDEQALQRSNLELERLGRTDGLTGLFNRRAWEEQLNSEYKRHQRRGQDSALVMFDIDHFKKVNDTYGHQAGDAVIRAVAERVCQTKREPDIAGRYGGEEFGVVLVDTDGIGAMRFAERLRESVMAHPVHYEGQEIRYTISLGVAPITEDGSTQWIAAADAALYASKHGGRNRATLFGAVSV
jgi:diguanylate cyclase (GGDEF)-like protein